MGLTVTALLADFKASLQDASGFFTAANDADFIRHLNVAARAVALSKISRTLIGNMAVQAGVSEYAAPADLLLPKAGFWTRLPIDVTDIPSTPNPVLSLAELDGSVVLVLTPAPTAAQIAVYGSTYGFYYFASHELTDQEATSTLPERSRNLVLLRAQAEACRELALRQLTKPISLRAGGGSTAQTRNMTPSALFQALMEEFGRTAA